MEENQLEIFQGLAGYCKAETTFTFYFSILTLSSAFLSIDNIEMKSESGFSFAMASQPFRNIIQDISMFCCGKVFKLGIKNNCFDGALSNFPSLMASLAITIKTTEELDNVHTVRDSVKGFYACIH